ncbi:hypothetical protein [Kineococcus sp. SYSU DK003]|uniref:hypothetical protein n=1 Tax=Kineococcus sp. SYSU DK003 TaxID=3383124 RepID=UPI003D7E29C3
MSEHRRGVDEADVVRALQRAGSADAGVDVSALVAGARGRARTIRRRRQGMAGVVAVLALGIPVGVWQWPTTPTTVTPASPTRPAVTAIPDDALPTTQDITSVVPGLAPRDENESANTGFCTDLAHDGSSTVVDARTLGWGGEANVVSAPFPESVSVRVLLFRGDAAQDWMAQASADAEACTVQGNETAPFTLSDEAGVDAEQVLAGTAAYQQSGTNPMWTAKVVARSGQLVVTADVQTYQPTGSDTLTQAVQIVNAQLARAADLREAGGAAR